MDIQGSTGEAADPLLELELKVAQRADELVKSRGSRTPFNLECWIDAETEVLREYPPPLRPQ